MIELGELQKQHEEFARRGVQIFVVSNDDRETAQATQSDFPNLFVVSDEDQSLAKAIQVIHPGASPTGDDTNAPTTFLVDGTGQVRWTFRPDRFMVRLSPEQLLEAIDKTWPK